MPEDIPSTLVQAPEPAAAPPDVSIDIAFTRVATMAMRHNDVRLIHSLRLATTAPIERATLHVSLSDDLAPPLTRTIERLDPDAPLTLDDIDLPLNPGALAAATEARKAALTVELRAADNSPIARRVESLDVLPFDQWPGAAVLPELLAAFITPNHPAVADLLRQTADILQRTTGDSALSGYQSASPQRACAQAQALYRAAADRAIAYVNPPANFADRGQRIRLADQTLSERLGTCLDLALMLASALEQIGLNPLVVIIEGHAFIALWTFDESFPEPVIDDSSRLRKRIELGELIAFEATAITASPAPDFAAAAAAAQRHLENPDRFRFAIDVRAARRARIRPLPQRVGPGIVASDLPVTVSDVALTPLDAAGPAPAPVLKPTLPLTPAQQRLDRWTRKLLDLSGRNRLINSRPTRQTIELECPDLAALEDALSGGETFIIFPRTQVMGEADPRDAQAQVNRTGEDARQAFLREELARRRLHAAIDGRDLDSRLVTIYRAARASINESGVNTLYLALGSLLWTENGDSNNQRRAPIFLMPMTLERISAREGFQLRAADEEPRINNTLLEKLRVDFKIDTSPLSDIPEDASGLDLASLFTRFRQAARDIAGWEVKETAELGLFSFNKFLMWADLSHRTHDLLRSDVVRAMVDPDASLPSVEAFPDPSQLDAHAAELLCPLDADSSQLAAVLAGASDRSFVLEGPPGTGKSQTITNLIAHALGQGKRILFVAEKLAALEVVHTRLARCGLAPFCLEIHSHKAGKKEVLDQIRAALDAANAPPPADWEHASTRLAQARAELNTYAETLHLQREPGFSIYEALARIEALADAPTIPLALESPLALTRDDIDALHQKADDLAIACRAVAPIPSHPLRGLHCTTYSPDMPERARALLEHAESALAAFDRALAAAAQALASTPPPATWTSEDRALFLQLASLLRDCPGIAEPLLTEHGWATLKPALEAWIERIRRRDADRASLFSRYRPDILNLDLASLQQSLQSAASKGFFLTRYFASRAPRKLLASVSRSKPADLESLLADVRLARSINAESAAIAQSPDLARFFARAFNQGKPDIATLQRHLDWADRARATLRTLSASAALAPLAPALTRLATTGIDDLAPGAPLRSSLDTLAAAHASFLNALSEADALLRFDADAIDPRPGTEGSLASIRGILARWKAGRDDLSEWCYWRRSVEAAGERLAPLVEALEAGRLTPDSIAPALERAILDSWLGAIFQSAPLLRDFTADAATAALERFRALDRRVIDLSRDVLLARLASRIPPPGANIVEGSEMGLLQRQFKLQRRHMPVRRLVERLPNLLPRLKPCFLMSPLSVAQYLDPAHPPFDLVIFDEASQIPVWDAIGAIARARHVIIVGDSRQLPPTNFFQRLEGDEEPLEDDFEELESVLDEASARGIPSLRLLWHYRSRHESLIAFSNRHYYGDRLHTFPSPVRSDPSLGVSLRLVQGVYERSRTRTNPIEARALVDELVSRLRAAVADSRPLSIGVVTFSQAQQLLIEDLLDDARRRCPDIEPFFTQADEPVFVKNLESVQGDERDVILFSICYAADDNGRLSMFFGPLNRVGGERRLNVAITRARSQVIVFSSIRADQIDLARTSSVGAAHLRAFLDYAADAGSESPRIPAGSDAPLDVARALRAALAERGFESDLSVGRSGYRLDLAVRHPARPGEYILGVEIDGPYYHDAATARDRERLRQQVLASLGWRLVRLWTPEWRLHRRKALERIITSIEEAVAGAPLPPPPPPPPPSESPVAEALPTASRADSSVTLYRAFTGRPRGSADAFYEPRTAPAIAKALREVVAFEGPILLPLATRRIGALWGFSRITSRIEARLHEVLASDAAPDAPRLINDVLWPSTLDPDTYSTFRPAGPEPDDARAIDEIPRPELAAASAAALAQHVALPLPELARQTALLLGFSRLTPKAEALLTQAIRHLESRGRCVIGQDKVTLP